MKEELPCICEGNWRTIISECQELIGRKFLLGDDEYVFFGVVHGADDYYYGMYSGKSGIQLLSCVGSIEGHGYALEAPDKFPTNIMVVSDTGEVKKLP